MKMYLAVIQKELGVIIHHVTSAEMKKSGVYSILTLDDVKHASIWEILSRIKIITEIKS